MNQFINILKIDIKSLILTLLLILPSSIMADSSIVAIDIGHTPKKYGCTSARGMPEYIFNKRIAIELHSALYKEGVDSFIINDNSSEIGLLERTKEAQRRGASLFISIHHDSAQLKYFSRWKFNGNNLKYSDQFSGYSIFISLKNKYSKNNQIFADILGEQLLRNGFNPTLHHAEKIKGENRELIDREKGIYRFDKLAVLRTASMPALLLECGVIVNRDEELNLNNIKNRAKLVRSLVYSIKSYN